MKIAQVAQLWESVPPQRYGGVERVVSYVTEELHRLGHEATLFASGDSRTAARLEAVCAQALRLNPDIVSLEAPLTLLMERAFGSAEEFDIIHSHLDFLAFPLTRRCSTPVVTTIHGWLDLPELAPVFREFAELPLVSISDAQRRPFPWANWVATVHHGLPHDLYRFSPGPGKYLAFLGRISPDKGTDQVIKLARKVGLPVRIAARLDPYDREYFREVLQPLLDHPLVEHVGEITDSQKQDFLGNALALVCPSIWPEAFGLVVIEALACGTPVLAYHRGAMPELIEHGTTGFLCETFDDLVAAIPSLSSIDRRQCRSSFERRFTVDRMIRDYLQVYQQLIGASLPINGSRGHHLSHPVIVAS